MDRKAYNGQYRAYLTRIEDFLDNLMRGKPAWADLYEAMRYSLLSGGKRLRPVLTLAFSRLAEPEGDWQAALWPACALELVHTYSLIHDDLPCMDNDDLRRGKPTNHKVYGETMAILAGDALQAAAYELILDCHVLSQSQRAECALLLAEASGPNGMVAGQVLDTLHAPQTEKELIQTHALKTGAMIRCACMMGYVCGGLPGGEENFPLREAVRAYAENLGLAFQIRDDMLDVMGEEATFGKPIGSDKAEGKVTFVDLLGLEECERRVRDYTEKAKSALTAVHWRGDPAFLCQLADELTTRES